MIALAFVLSYIVYMVIKKNRTPRPATATTPAKPLNIKLWVTMSIAIVAAIWFFTSPYGFGKCSQYVWSWELPRGYSINGLTKSQPTPAEIIPCSGGALWINVYYTQHGVPEVTRIRLNKVGDDSWEGDWEQNNPVDYGRCKLHKVASGTWAGTLVGTAGIPTFCTLKPK